MGSNGVCNSGSTGTPSQATDGPGRQEMEPTMGAGWGTLMWRDWLAHSRATSLKQLKQSSEGMSNRRTEEKRDMKERRRSASTCARETPHCGSKGASRSRPSSG